MTVYNDTNNYYLPPQGRAVVGSPQGRAVVGNVSGPAVSVTQDGINIEVSAVEVGNSTVTWSDSTDSGSFSVTVSYSQLAGYINLEQTAPEGLGRAVVGN